MTGTVRESRVPRRFACASVGDDDAMLIAITRRYSRTPTDMWHEPTRVIMLGPDAASGRVLPTAPVCAVGARRSRALGQPGISVSRPGLALGRRMPPSSPERAVARVGAHTRDVSSRSIALREDGAPQGATVFATRSEEKPSSAAAQQRGNARTRVTAAQKRSSERQSDNHRHCRDRVPRAANAARDAQVEKPQVSEARYNAQAAHLRFLEPSATGARNVRRPSRATTAKVCHVLRGSTRKPQVSAIETDFRGWYTSDTIEAVATGSREVATKLCHVPRDGTPGKSREPQVSAVVADFRGCYTSDTIRPVGTRAPSTRKACRVTRQGTRLCHVLCSGTREPQVSGIETDFRGWYTSDTGVHRAKGSRMLCHVLCSGTREPQVSAIETDFRGWYTSDTIERFSRRIMPAIVSWTIPRARMGMRVPFGLGRSCRGLFVARETRRERVGVIVISAISVEAVREMLVVFGDGCFGSSRFFSVRFSQFFAFRRKRVTQKSPFLATRLTQRFRFSEKRLTRF